MFVCQNMKKNFIFIVNCEEFHTSQLAADILSPKKIANAY